MSFRTTIAALAVAALTLAPSVARAQAAEKQGGTAVQKVDDSTLDNRIEARLKANASLKKESIDVAVDNGVVTLTGTVHSRALRTRAEQLAKIKGVTRVDNKLEVETAPTSGKMEKAGEKADKTMEKAGEKADKTMDKAGEKAEKATEKAKEKSEKAGEKSKDALSETGEAITDAWITTKVKTQFVGEDALKDSDINVDTVNHVVTLKGTVVSPAGRARAVAIAKATKGVTRVVDNLIVAPKK